MRDSLRATSLAILFTMAAVPAFSQEKSKKDEKRDCGVTSDQLKKNVNGDSGKDAERQIDEHFKKNHPDGRCHCACKHDEAKPSCGLDRDGYKKHHKKKGQDDKECDRETEEHFIKVHPGDTVCHCTCEHTAKQKGNNGLGNGIDPQPPGNPPVNDGPGTGPGNPGNKKHGVGESGKGKPEKGAAEDDDKGKGKPPGDKGKGKPKS